MRPPLIGAKRALTELDDAGRAPHQRLELCRRSGRKTESRVCGCVQPWLDTAGVWMAAERDEQIATLRERGARMRRGAPVDEKRDEPVTRPRRGSQREPPAQRRTIRR